MKTSWNGSWIHVKMSEQEYVVFVQAMLTAPIWAIVRESPWHMKSPIQLWHQKSIINPTSTFITILSSIMLPLSLCFYHQSRSTYNVIRQHVIAWIPYHVFINKTYSYSSVFTWNQLPVKWTNPCPPCKQYGDPRMRSNRATHITTSQLQSSNRVSM